MFACPVFTKLLIGQNQKCQFCHLELTTARVERRRRSEMVAASLIVLLNSPKPASRLTIYTAIHGRAPIWWAPAKSCTQLYNLHRPEDKSYIVFVFQHASF